MEILWWLAPSAGVLVVAMAWVSWLGREGRGEVDRDVAAAKLARALDKDEPRRRRSVRPAPDARATGVAVRRSRVTASPAAATPPLREASPPPGRTGAVDPPVRRVS